MSKYMLGRKYFIGQDEDILVKIINKDLKSYTVECDGYIHKFAYSNVFKFKNTYKTMIDSDYLKYVNELIFHNTGLNAIEVIKSNTDGGRRGVVVLNIENGNKYRCASPLKANINRIIATTTRSDRIRQRVIEALGSFYDYSKTICNSQNDMSIVTCPIHGDFEIRIMNTLSKGCGCPECSKNAFKYSRSGFINLCKAKDKMGILYLIKCESKNDNKNELFYKIGITTRTVMERAWSIPYKTETILIIESDPEYIYDLENVLHRKLSEFAYLPRLNFKGRTECFKFKNEEEITDIINEYKVDLK